MTYYKLLDPKNYGTIVKANGPKQYQYIIGRGWVRSGILMEYFWDESDLYEKYEEISEDEANKLISSLNVTI